jgi:hypothetical protein
MINNVAKDKYSALEDLEELEQKERELEEQKQLCMNEVAIIY